VASDCTGSRIEAVTNVKLDDGVSEKTVMVRAARQLLSTITKVLILADRVVIKQLVTAKDQVYAHYTHLASAGFTLYCCYLRADQYMTKFVPCASWSAIEHCAVHAVKYLQDEAL